MQPAGMKSALKDNFGMLESDHGNSQRRPPNVPRTPTKTGSESELERSASAKILSKMLKPYWEHLE